MKNYEILRTIQEFDKIYIAMTDALIKEKLELFDKESYTKFINSLYAIIQAEFPAILAKSKDISKIMDPKKLTSKQYYQFYSDIVFTKEEYELLRAKFTSLISFEFPVLELFPGTGTFTKEAVAGEPLYIADYFMENLEKIGSQVFLSTSIRY